MSNRSLRNYLHAKTYPYSGSLFSGLDDFYEDSTPQGLQNSLKGYQLREKEGHYIVTLDVPGVDPDNIEITIDQNILKVAAVREDAEVQSSYSSSFLMPKDINEEEIKALCEHGVLKIALAKSNSKKERSISLSSNEDRGFFDSLFSSNDKKKVDVDLKN